MKTVVRISKQKVIKPTMIMENWTNGRWGIATGKQNTLNSFFSSHTHKHSLSLSLWGWKTSLQFHQIIFQINNGAQTIADFGRFFLVSKLIIESIYDFLLFIQPKILTSMCFALNLHTDDGDRYVCTLV